MTPVVAVDWPLPGSFFVVDVSCCTSVSEEWRLTAEMMPLLRSWSCPLSFLDAFSVPFRGSRLIF